MDYESNTYLAVTLAQSFKGSPDALNFAHPSANHVGQVGALDNVQLMSVSKDVWAREQDEIISRLKQADGVQRVDIQVLKQRAKRDEF